MCVCVLNCVDYWVWFGLVFSFVVDDDCQLPTFASLFLKDLVPFHCWKSNYELLSSNS